MRILLVLAALIVFQVSCTGPVKSGNSKPFGTLTMHAEKRYLNIPVSHEADRSEIRFRSQGMDDLAMKLRLAGGKPDYWVFLDIDRYRGKNIEISYTGSSEGLSSIYQDDNIAGSDSLYKETNRPQVHFTSRRGWNNDPNGLVFFDGEYHLFYQHNPLEREWENMSWGHAVSRDLLHWNELPLALLPDTLGTIFSGSAVIDIENTAGWGKDAMVVFYTSAGKEMKQCIAYSTDLGRTFARYQGNPVLGPDRDPKVFWHEPSGKWVLVLYNDNYNAIYNSSDLKTWEFKSKVPGYYECPELFELPVDGNKADRKWVMYGASGTYMTGSFDGAVFKPEHGKYYYSWGCQYAAQTYNNTPDGRRIQIGWGRVVHEGMPFNQMMLFPCELSLRTTPEGLRLFCEPVREIEKLHERSWKFSEIKGGEANVKLAEIGTDLLHVRMDIEIIHGLDFEIRFRGNKILSYDGNYGRFNGAPYTGDIPESLRFSVELLTDRTSCEAWIGKGRLYLSDGLKSKQPDTGLSIHGDVVIHSLEIYGLQSIWK